MSLWAFCSAVVLVFGYLAASDQDVILISAAFLAISGIISAGLQRYPDRPTLQLAAYLVIGVGIGLSQIAFAAEAAWSWWLGLAGWSAMPMVLRQRALPRRMLDDLIYLALIVGAMFIGVLAANSISGDVAVISLGLVLLGPALLFVRYGDAQPQSVIETLITRESTSVDAELSELSTRIHVTTDGLVRAAQAINDVTSQQSNGASEQVDVIRLTNDMLDNFLALSERINGQARTMTDSASDARHVSEEGDLAIKQAIDGMQQIRSQVSNIGITITTLAQLTKRIDEIITSVTEIATQSNLLALNASIEAARAGTHGRGFAVVADEVRSLSQQSTTAANQVRAILAEIQSAVRQTINATEIGMQGVDSGVEMTQRASRIMAQLTKSVSASNEAVRSIYEVIRQQAEGLEEIAISMDRIDRITQQNLASTRMVATVSTNLTRLADDLQSVVEAGHILDYSAYTDDEPNTMTNTQPLKEG